MQPSKDLRLNGTTVSAFRHAIHSCNIDAIPGIVRQLLETQAWRSFVANMEPFENQTFTEFIRDPPFKGCGWEPNTVETLIRRCGDDDLLERWREETTAPKGQAGRSNNYPVSIRPRHGNDRAYLLGRLRRERNDLFEDVQAGKLKAKQAARKAGWKGYELKKRCPKCGYEY